VPGKYRVRVVLTLSTAADLKDAAVEFVDERGSLGALELALGPFDTPESVLADICGMVQANAYPVTRAAPFAPIPLPGF